MILYHQINHDFGIYDEISDMIFKIENTLSQNLVRFKARYAYVGDTFMDKEGH